MLIEVFLSRHANHEYGLTVLPLDDGAIAESAGEHMDAVSRAIRPDAAVERTVDEEVRHLDRPRRQEQHLALDGRRDPLLPVLVPPAVLRCLEVRVIVIRRGQVVSVPVNAAVQLFLNNILDDTLVRLQTCENSILESVHSRIDRICQPVPIHNQMS